MKRKTTRRLCGILLAFIVIISQSACAANEKTNDNPGISKTGFYLDTVCTITIFGMDDAEGSLAALDEENRQRELYQLITDAFKLCDSYEKILSKTIETSDIAKINRAEGRPVHVSDTAAAVIRKGIEYGELSEGAFDITIGKATDLWDFHEAAEADESENGGKIPAADTLAEAMRHVDYTKVKLDGNTVQLADSEMELDLGGIAKGYIADRITEYLKERGVTSAIVDLGGNIVAIGGKARSLTDPEAGETEFTIGIKDPQSETGTLLGTLPAKDKTIVTSGTYERYFMAGGKKYHHILNSQTGYPTDTDVLSATIIAEKGRSADCDGLSTSCLALGVEKALQLVESLDGIEAILVDTDGRIHQSSETIGFTQ